MTKAAARAMAQQYANTDGEVKAMSLDRAERERFYVMEIIQPAIRTPHKETRE